MPIEVVEKNLRQTSNEELIYSITTTNWGTSPTSPAVTANDETTRLICTTTVFPTNSPSVAGNVISLSPLKSLTEGHTYRINVKFSTGGNVYECYFKVFCEV